MSIVISTLIQLALAYCLIIFLVLTLRSPMYKIAGARWVYVLWFTLLVPLIILVLPTAMLSSFMPLTMQELSLPERVNSIVSFNSLNIFIIALAVLWAGGVIVTIWRNARTNSRLAIGVKANCRQLTTNQVRKFDRLCRKSGVFPSPEIRYSPDVDGPALLGVVNPLLLLPVQFFDKFNQSEQALMICHELVHYRRKDTCWNLLFCILRCVFWFNPLIGLAESRFRLDQELSCDQSVLCDEPLSQRAHYAAAMLKASSPSYSSGLIGFRNNSPEVLSRVKRLHHHRVSPAQSVFGPVGFALLLITATVLSTPIIEDGYSSSVSPGWCGVYQNLGL
jgi:bla regulator protein BlaR1